VENGSSIDFTPYPDVNAILGEVLSGARQVLSGRMIGMYLYGSLATGGFKPGRSDIDFLVVTDADLPEDRIEALRAMHQQIGAGPSAWALELEGSYIPAAALRRYDPGRSRHPHIDRGSAELNIEQHDTDWVVQRWVTRERGIRLAGPPAEALIDPISADALRAAVRELFFTWWAPMAIEPSRLTQTSYQVYAVLTMPRILYTFVHGSVTAKPEAAAWALATLGPRWGALLAEALDWEDGKPFDHLEDARGLIRYTAGQAGAAMRPGE
jgi:hypothetical protein